MDSFCEEQALWGNYHKHYAVPIIENPYKPVIPKYFTDQRLDYDGRKPLLDWNAPDALCCYWDFL